MSETASTPMHSRPVAIAPAPNGKSESQEAEKPTMPYTCVTCTRRKVKCDKTAPVCSTCRKARLDCEYQEPAPRKRKRKAVGDVHDKLEEYERILRQNGLLPHDESETTTPAETKPFYNQQTSAIRPGKLLQGEGKSRYIDSNIWHSLGVDNYNASSDEEDDEIQNVPTSGYLPTPTADPVSSALLGPSSPSANLLDWHPSYDTAMKLWNIYVENIDPITKVVHVPTGITLLRRAASSPGNISRATEALVFAIYHIALTTISDDECQKLFGEPQRRLVAKYHDAARQALVNAGFLRTTDVIVLQAYVLYLLSVRNVCDPHTFWILTGILVRIAQRIGFHRDGEALNLKPFDVEMRRRIFWQVIPLDGLAGQLCGTGICLSTDSWDTKQPLNVNDTDIWPDMETAPEPRTGATDVFFCLARSELGRFVQKANPPGGNWSRMWESANIAEKDEQFDLLEKEMETKYIRYCDFANPLHNLVGAMARSSVNAGRLRIRLSKAKGNKDLSDADRAEIWNIANRMLDYDIAAHSNQVLARFMWHLQAFFQWDPFVFALSEIRRDPITHGTDQMWSKIEKIFDNHPAMVEQRRALHIAVAQLTLRGWEASEHRSKRGPHDEPPFIVSLRKLTRKRESRSNSSAPNSYNPFDPMQDASDDLEWFKYSNNSTNPIDFNFNHTMDFSNDSVDWYLWDQLIHDQNAFPATWGGNNHGL